MSALSLLRRLRPFRSLFPSPLFREFRARSLVWASTPLPGESPQLSLPKRFVFLVPAVEHCRLSFSQLPLHPGWIIDPVPVLTRYYPRTLRLSRLFLLRLTLGPLFDLAVQAQVLMVPLPSRLHRPISPPLSIATFRPLMRGHLFSFVV